MTDDAKTDADQPKEEAPKETKTEPKQDAKPPATDPTAMGLMAAALARAQLQFTNPKKKLEVKVRMKSGGEYSFMYADLAAVLDVIRKPLAENGIAIIQKVKQNGERVYLQTILMHSEGGWISTDPIEVGSVASDIKDVGGLLTYWRRYCLSALVGIASEEDGVEQNGVGAGQGEPIRNNPYQGGQQNAGYNPPAKIGWEYKHKNGVLHRSDDGKWTEYDATSYNEIQLGTALDYAKKRAKHYATETDKKGPLLDAQRDIQTLKHLLKKFEKTDTPPDGDKKTETEKPVEADQAAGAETKSDDPETKEPVDDENAIAVVKEPATLKSDLTPGTVKTIDEPELEMLFEMEVPEFAGMVAHVDNIELFHTDLGKSFIEANEKGYTGHDFKEWLTEVWLPVHEQDPRRARLARRLLRVAIGWYSLADRMTGTKPELHIRNTTPEEYKRLKDFADATAIPEKKEGKYEL